MKMQSPLFAVKDMDKSVAFYRQTLGLRVVADFGANKTLTGGLSLQTHETWLDFVKLADNVTYGGNDSEVYFEEDDFDAFVERLAAMEGIEYANPVTEYPWGQRTVRIYDPDRHILEIGENMKTVCRRFADSGMTPAAIAAKMDVPEKFVNAWLRGK